MLDCIVIGGGQAGLATGYYLRKKRLDFQILDAEPSPGAAWRHAWPSLTLFSNSASSNLPGLPMPHHDGFPPASHVIDYFTRYEQRYDLPVRRPVRVQEVTHDGERFHVTTDDELLTARTVVAATGTWSSPFIPYYPGFFAGRQWHSAVYPGPDPFRGESVTVVGAGNSGALAFRMYCKIVMPSRSWLLSLRAVRRLAPSAQREIMTTASGTHHHWESRSSSR